MEENLAHTNYLLIYNPKNNVQTARLDWLQREDIEIKYAEDKKSMIDIMRDREAAAVIAFCNSEKHNEIDFLRYIMRQHPHTQRIYLTDRLENDLIESAINKAHVNYLLILPFEPLKLKEIVHKAFKRYRFLKKPVRRLNDLTNIAAELLEDINKYRDEAGTDALTTLLNRRSFDQILDKGIALYTRKKLALTLIMIDLDDFKKLNDTFGHAAGDEILRRFGQFLRENVRLEDSAFRYGGEEFAIIANGDDPDNIKNLVERIRGDFYTQHISYEEHVLKVTFSAGIATMRSGFNKNDLIRAADKALYKAKKSGKNCIVDWNEL